MAAKSSSLESVARPKQARSEQTLQRLLDAAESLIEEKGLADASIPEIVRRAGSSVGGFYARFRDKNELLRALEERFFLQVSERLETLLASPHWRSASMATIARRCVEELVDIVGEHAALIQAFVFRSAQDPEFREDGARFRGWVARRITDLLLPRRDHLAHPEPEVGIEIAVQLAFGFMTQFVVFGEARAGGRSLSRDALVDELTRAFVGYLTLPERA